MTTAAIWISVAAVAVLVIVGAWLGVREYRAGRRRAPADPDDDPHDMRGMFNDRD